MDINKKLTIVDGVKGKAHRSGLAYDTGRITGWGSDDERAAIYQAVINRPKPDRDNSHSALQFMARIRH